MFSRDLVRYYFRIRWCDLGIELKILEKTSFTFSRSCLNKCRKNLQGLVLLFLCCIIPCFDMFIAEIIANMDQNKTASSVDMQGVYRVLTYL